MGNIHLLKLRSPCLCSIPAARARSPSSPPLPPLPEISREKRKQNPAGFKTHDELVLCACTENPGPINPHDKYGKTLSCPYRIYRIWHNMIKRGGLKARKSFQRDRHAQYYVNVVVCDAWRDFEKFYNWAMLHGYRDDLTIDRIDCRRGYCPEDCAAKLELDEESE